MDFSSNEVCMAKIVKDSLRVGRGTSFGAEAINGVVFMDEND